MASINPSQLSPFGQSALELDMEFVELERLGGQLERLAIDSDSGLDRAKEILVKFAECGQRVATGVQSFAKTMEEARLRAEKAAGIVAERAYLVQDRQQANNKMQERFHMLSEMLVKIAAVLAKLKGQDTSLLQKELPEIDSQLLILVDEAKKLKADAHESKMKSVERNADSLGQSVLAARRKLAVFLDRPSSQNTTH